MTRRVFFWLLALVGIRPPIIHKITLQDGSWVKWEEIMDANGQLMDGRIVSSSHDKDIIASNWTPEPHPKILDQMSRLNKQFLKQA